MKTEAADTILPNVWITKYALTKGVYAVENVARCGSIDNGMIKVGNHGYFHGEGKDWHLTEASALARAEAMRTSRIAALRKQISALEKRVFVVKS